MPFHISSTIAAVILLLGLPGVGRSQSAYSISQPLEDGEFAVVNHGRGQSFTVSSQGQGTGSLSGATQVQLNDVTFMYGQAFQAAAAAGSGSTLYVYDTMPANLADLNTGVGALYASTSASANGFFATHRFTSALLDSSKTYYLFYNSNRQFRYSFASNPYSGGRMWYRQSPTGAWQEAGGADQLDAYFLINTTTVTGGGEPPAPEIEVQQSRAAGLRDGKSTVSFPSVKKGRTGQTKTFVIRNTGKATLKRLSLGITGLHKSSFTTRGLAVKELAPGARTTFQVTFKPQAAGQRKAVVRIVNTDGDENPFTFVVTGTGK
jgi:hypothetical protein